MVRSSTDSSGPGPAKPAHPTSLAFGSLRAPLGSILMTAGCATAATVGDVRKMGEAKDGPGLMKAWQESEGDGVRIAVIEAFSQNPADGEGRALIFREARSSTSDQVRLAAVRSLGAYGGEEMVPILVGALGDAFPAIRDVAKSELGKIGEGANDPLFEALGQSENHLVRASCARLLTRAAKGTDKQLRLRVGLALLDAARGDDAPKVREAAINGLGTLNEPKARPVLTELMKTDGDAGVRMAAERALGKIGPTEDDAQIVIAVLPFKNETGAREGELGALGQQIADYMAARISSSKVCQVVDREKMERALKEMEKIGVHLYDGDSLNAPELGRFKMANQLVYGTVQKQGQVFTIVANRMDVSTLELVPGASVTVSGYRSDLEQLKAELTERFIKNFR
jgi:TolB-like protein